MHYCGGELESIKINSNPVSCCCGDVDTSNTCCQNEELILELNIDQQTSSFTNIIPDNLFLLASISFKLDLFHNFVIDIDYSNEYKIPPPKQEPIRLLNCSLTYYG